MRVLLVTNMWPRPDRPGFGVFVQAQAASLCEAGAEVRPFVLEGDRGRHVYLTRVPALRRAVRRWRPDVVHAHFGYTGFTASFQPAPMVVSFCGDDLFGAPGELSTRLRSRAAMMMSRYAARSAAAIICKSRGLVDALPRPYDRARAEVVPNGVNFQLFAPGDRAESRRRLQIDPHAELVLFPHDPRQAAHKGFALAHAAMQVLRVDRPAVLFCQVRGRPHAEMPDWFRAADCMLLTSETEGSPNVVKEALATGCPVVSVDVGDVQRWLALVDGCAIVERTPQAVAQGVRSVLDTGVRPDPEAVRPFLDSRVIAKHLLRIYESVSAGASSSL